MNVVSPPPVALRKAPFRLTPESGRVLIQPFDLGCDDKCRRVIEAVLARPHDEVVRAVKCLLEEFEDRHVDLAGIFSQRYLQIRHLLPEGAEPTNTERLLIGAHFMSEYALESAALFNPSIVAHPNQTGIAADSLRIVMSLRATGEGHISSIEFRGGLIDGLGNVNIDPSLGCVTGPLKVEHPLYQNALIRGRLVDLGLLDEFIDCVLNALGASFTLEEAESQIVKEGAGARDWSREQRAAARHLLWIARCNYEVHFGNAVPLSQRVIFPQGPSERQGIEDARFVRFTDDDGGVHYYATYTAWDGESILPQLIKTDDFLHFKMRTMSGPLVRNKGMALFPRKIGGKFAMISRQDDENLFLMFSDNLYHWDTATLLARPEQPWESVKIGNCGSPIETDAGWIVLTHGVGAMRKYSIGAMLLDRETPSRVLGRLRRPLIEPDENEREGYVPNVVYSCGGLLHRGHVVIPYAMSDYATTVATVEADELVAAMREGV